MTFEKIAADTDRAALDDAAVRQHVVVHLGAGATAPKIDLAVYLPAHANGPLPLVLQISFAPAFPPANLPPGSPRDTTPIAQILARGYAYATFRYTDIEGDRAETNLSLLRASALAPGETKPAAGEWGTISAWAWGTSRVLDYFATEPAVDAKRVALVGHSRLGKTVLWAGASDPRFALIFSSCAGEMGSALSRRDYGETIDDMAANFPWQFTARFQKYAGHWNDLPVDAHMLIALNAPRPVFITAGTEDQWADPRGEFLAEVAAGPVYRLLGRRDLGTTEMPAVDTPLVNGDLGYLCHTGRHAVLPADWDAFLNFTDAHLQPGHGTEAPRAAAPSGE